MIEREGLFERIDRLSLPHKEVLPQSIRDFGVAGNYWSTVIGYNPERLGKAKPAPANWADFWDLKKYTGQRSLRDDPVATLEFSLMAQGVERDSIYPLDIERALSSLDIIADHVPVWWEAGNRTNELLTDGAVLLSSGWNRRFHNAKAKGMPIEMVWEEGILSSQWRVIPKGAPHVDLARKFIAFATTAEPQAEFARLIPYGPVSFKALDLLSAERLQVIPTSLENLPRQMIINDDWWVENMDSVRNRWKEWRSAE